MRAYLPMHVLVNDLIARLRWCCAVCLGFGKGWTVIDHLLRFRGCEHICLGVPYC